MPSCEPVEGHVFVEGLDHPIPPNPLVGFPVELKAVAVGITGGVQPLEGHSLSITGAFQKVIDDFFVGIGGVVVEEGIHFLGRGGQSDQVGVETFDQNFLGRLYRRWQVAFIEFGKNKAIDRVANPFGTLDRWKGLFGRRHEGPMFLVFGSFLDPSLENVLLFTRKDTVGLRRRHDFVFIGRVNAVNEFARIQVSRHEGIALDRIRSNVES